MASRIDTRTHSNSVRATLLAVIALVAAAGAAVVGVVLVAQMIASRSPASIVVPPGQEARADGLALRIDVAEWLSHNMLSGMPASAMPDMPAPSEQRFRLAFTLTNEGAATRDFGPGDFVVRSSGGESWSPFGSNFMTAALRPGQAINGSIFFHVPEGEPGLRLVWSRGSTEVEIPMGDTPIADHDHY